MKSKDRNDFIRMLNQYNAIELGNLTMKSGKVSPIHIDLSKIYDGMGISILAYFYSRKIMEIGADFDIISGPPYRGIPLAVSTTESLYHHFGINKTYLTYRKDEKTYGNHGRIIGNIPKEGDSVIIIDDVFTTGATKEEAVNILKEYKANTVAIVTGVDRQEKIPGKEKSAAQNFSEKTGIPVYSIANMQQIINLLERDMNKEYRENRKSIDEYINENCWF
jgi:orotate phosphoribosyltransferase